jgi:hypothetical protein
VFKIEKGGAGLWKSLKSFIDTWPETFTIYEELSVLIDSLYGPIIPAGEIKMPETEYIGKSTMQALADSKRSDFSISREST